MAGSFNVLAMFFRKLSDDDFNKMVEANKNDGNTANDIWSDLGAQIRNTDASNKADSIFADIKNRINDPKTSDLMGLSFKNANQEDVHLGTDKDGKISMTQKNLSGTYDINNGKGSLLATAANGEKSNEFYDANGKLQKTFIFSDKGALRKEIKYNTEGWDQVITDYTGPEVKFISQRYDKSSGFKVVQIDNSSNKYFAETKKYNHQDFVKSLGSDDKNIIAILNKFKEEDKNYMAYSLLSQENISVEDKIALTTEIKDRLAKMAKKSGIDTQAFEAEFAKEISKVNSEIDLEQNAKIDKILTVMSDRIDYDKPNGKGDKENRQGDIGTCWILSGQKAFTINKKAAEFYKKNVTVDKETGDVSVYLPKAGKSYIVTREEILNATKYSTGDNDFRAVEIAVYDKYAMDNGIDRTEGFVSDGGKIADFFEIFTGKPVDDKMPIPDEHHIALMNNSQMNDENLNKLMALKSDVIMEGGTLSSASDLGIKGIVRNHGYTIAKIDKDYVYVINPHDTAKQIKLTREEFKKAFHSVASVKID